MARKPGAPKRATKGRKTTSGQAPRRAFRPDLQKLTRRGFLTLTALAIPGVWLIMDRRSREAAADISVIGGDKPVIIQVHDPGCPICRRLKRTVESVHPEFDSSLELRVVDITTRAGASFAREHDVGPRTLMLFNRSGNVHRVLEGPRQEDELREVFTALARHGQGAQ